MVPWVRPGSGFALLFEMVVLQLCREMSITVVADFVDEWGKRIWRILEHYVARARMNVDLSDFHTLGIDEFSIKKGHNYMSVFSDIDAARVIFVAESCRKETFDEFAADMEYRKYNLKNIDMVCCDMWDPYINGV